MSNNIALVNKKLISEGKVPSNQNNILTINQFVKKKQK